MDALFWGLVGLALSGFWTFGGRSGDRSSFAFEGLGLD